MTPHQKIMLMALSDIFDFVHHKLARARMTANSAFHIDAMKRLQDADKRKCPLKCTNNRILHQDNAHSHIPLLERQFVVKTKFQLSPSHRILLISLSATSRCAADQIRLKDHRFASVERQRAPRACMCRNAVLLRVTI